MAKRKRLSPATPGLFVAPESAPALSRAPIADVARDSASTAALETLSQEMAEARASGRMVLTLPLSAIVLDHLVRDRVTAETEEMEVLIASLAARGQQAPIEVMALPEGRYGLISGWRRCQALLRLTEDGGHDGTVLALLRTPSDASDAYLSMVEENEIRLGLSYFERARIALKAVEQGVFESEKAALLALFANASRAKRSKIRAFLPLVRCFDGALRFPHLIGERLGLKLSRAMVKDDRLAQRVLEALRNETAASLETEQALLERMISTVSSNAKSDQLHISEGGSKKDQRRSKGRAQIGDGLEATWEDGGNWLRVSGQKMTPELRSYLLRLLRENLF